MRKVYQKERSSLGLAVAVIFSVCVTLTIFCVIPFTHIINKPGKNVTLTQIRVTDMQERQEEKLDTPPPEPEKQKEEAPPEPQLTEAPQKMLITAELGDSGSGIGVLPGMGKIGPATDTQGIGGQEVFDASELERKPGVVTPVNPQYPAELRKAKIEGMVTVAFIVNENGRVEDARVENSSRPEFEKPTLDAIRKWKFTPGQKNGQAVRTYCRKPFRFTLPSG